MATITRLKHIELKIPKIPDGTLELAEKCHALLGYRGPLVSRNAVGQLGQILAELHIKPLDPVRVMAYKRDKAVAERTERRKRNRWASISVKWKMVELSGYRQHIPEFALRKAVQIKEALPEVEFHVDEMQVSQKRKDPFLVAQYKGEKYWIEVWDEGQFEKELIDGE